MAGFKVGDWVECVSARGLTIGKRYKIIDETTTDIYVIDDSGKRDGWMHLNFKPASFRVGDEVYYKDCIGNETIESIDSEGRIRGRYEYGILSNIWGSPENYKLITPVEHKEVKMSKYQKLKSRIEKWYHEARSKGGGWDKELDDILNEINYGRNCALLFKEYESNKVISAGTPKKLKGLEYRDFHYTSQCSKLTALKDAVMWLLENSDYKNENVDELIDKAKWEADPTARANLYYEFLMMVKEDAPFVWLAQTAHVEVMRTWIYGYYYNPCQSMDFWGIYKE